MQGWMRWTNWATPPLALPLRRGLGGGGKSPTLLHMLADALQADVQLVSILQNSLRAEPSSVLREGGVIADGFDAELDELRGTQTNCGDFLLELEARERGGAGRVTLKVEYNRVHGV